MREPMGLTIGALVLLVAGCGAGPSGGSEGSPTSSAASAPAPIERSVIGRWRDTRPMVSGTIEIARVNDRLVLEQTFELDGSVLRVDLREAGAAQGRRFDSLDGRAAGTHWVITPAGTLELYDSLGLMATLPPE